MKNVKQYLMSQFSMVDMQELKFFLAININRLLWHELYREAHVQNHRRASNYHEVNFQKKELASQNSSSECNYYLYLP